MTSTLAEAGIRLTGAVATEPVTARVAELGSRPPGEWTAGDLTFYVNEEIERIHGPQLPRLGTAFAIEHFHERFGADSVRIARHAFEARRGMWQGAPITVARFMAGHDEFFAIPILREISLSRAS